MYRVLCFLAMLSVANSFCFHKRHSWRRHRHFRDNDLFEDITEQMSQINKILKSTCDNNRTTEAFENEKFVINHHLPEYKEDYIDVVIKNRVIQTIAKKFVNDKDMFRDLRILPNSLDISRATWKFVDGNVIIILPFIEENKEFCIKDNEDMKLVPKEKEKIYDIDVRLNEDVLN